MALRKFRIVYHLADSQIIEQITDGLSAEAVEAALHQKFSQRHIVFVLSDGHVTFYGKADGHNGNPHPGAKYLRVETERILRYGIEEREPASQNDELAAVLKIK